MDPAILSQGEKLGEQQQPCALWGEGTEAGLRWGEETEGWWLRLTRWQDRAEKRGGKAATFTPEDLDS